MNISLFYETIDTTPQKATPQNNQATMMEDNARAKRQREADPSVADLLVWARKSWQHENPYVRSTAAQEERKFRSSFGCGPFVALTAWCMLVHHDTVPAGGTMEHFLWTLIFLKGCPKEAHLKILCGGADPKTIRLWVWRFLDALADLEPDLVCPCCCFVD